MTPLHTIGNLVRELLLQIPMTAVRGLFVAVPVVLLVWIWRLPREDAEPPGGATRWDENLKLWASVALLVQVAVYALF